jgi:Protein of unknown function (DUF3105)
MDRNRNRLLWAGLAAVIAVGGLLVYLSFTQKAYACLSEWTPPRPGASPAPGSTPQLGYFQDDQGHLHVADGTKVKYAFCPPASGQHYNDPGVAGPITPKLYGPNDQTVPANWIHNMEHGGFVVLYRCGSSDNCDANQQAALKAFFDSFPASPVCHVPKGVTSPVITRFDEMVFPYAALVWDWVMPMDSWQPDLALQFWNQKGDLTNPERTNCALPTESPAPGASGSPAPSDTTAPAGSPATTSPTPAGT